MQNKSTTTDAMANELIALDNHFMDLRFSYDRKPIDEALFYLLDHDSDILANVYNLKQSLMELAVLAAEPKVVKLHKKRFAGRNDLGFSLYKLIQFMDDLKENEEHLRSLRVHQFNPGMSDEEKENLINIYKEEIEQLQKKAS